MFPFKIKQLADFLALADPAKKVIINNKKETGGLIMPFINVKTNVPVSWQKEEALKAAFGKAIACIPGKSESWLMVGFEPECHLWFKGSSEPAAMVQISVFGSSTKDAYSKLTGLICDGLSSELGVPKDRIFVSYAETSNWGWNGSNF